MDADSSIALLHYAMQNSAGTEIDNADLALELSKVFNDKRLCDSIAYWNRVSEQIYEGLSVERGLAEVLYQKAFEAFCLGDYKAALDYSLQGLGKMEDLQDEAGIALGYLRISRIFHFTYKMAQSAENGEKAGILFEKVADYPNAWDSWSFAGHGYRLDGDSIQAQYAFERGMEMAEKSGVSEIMGLAYNDLGAFYMEYNQYDSAMIYFRKALANCGDQNSRQKMVIQNGLGQVYLATGQYQACIDLLRDALKVVYASGEVFFLTELPEYMARSYAALGQYDSAYKYMEINSRFSDSLFTEDQDKALEEMQSKYESDRKDALIARQKSERIYGITLILAVCILAFMLYRRYLVKKRTNEILDQRNREKDFLLREIHHRVKNNLQILSSLLNLQSEYIKDENASNAIMEGRNRVQSMAFIHQQLYSHENVTGVDMRQYLTVLCDHLHDSFTDEKKYIDIVSDIRIGFVDVETAIPLGLIVNELITNSIKYAFKRRDQGTIKVSLWQNDHNQLVLVVVDDGEGTLSNGAKEGSSFGTDLIAILSKKLKGQISTDTSKGYSTRITFDRYQLLENMPT
ncbi:MAG: hypothetical protein KDC53_02555 [Saprospiraceae bacterium]|nr:hypothetical protein [Saprospiraceae bacterium]